MPAGVHPLNSAARLLLQATDMEYSKQHPLHLEDGRLSCLSAAVIDSWTCCSDMTAERPWLKPHAVTPSAAEPQPATRLRPLIYVYDLPSDFNTRLLQVGCISIDWRRLQTISPWYDHKWPRR
jgi:hypothetical protein